MNYGLTKEQQMSCFKPPNREKNIRFFIMGKFLS